MSDRFLQASIALSAKSFPDLSNLRCRYLKIVQYKTAYYSFYLPVSANRPLGKPYKTLARGRPAASFSIFTEGRLVFGLLVLIAHGVSRGPSPFECYQSY